jgi:DNA-binding transcriptional MerR regulator
MAESTGGRDGMGKYVMSIAVAMTGVEASRIRRYEAAGVLRPCRTGGGLRLFSDADIALIREVAKLEAEGVNLSGIRVILEMRRRTAGR